jgi:hypothetical protein
MLCPFLLQFPQSGAACLPTLKLAGAPLAEQKAAAPPQHHMLLCCLDYLLGSQVAVEQHRVLFGW